MRSAYAFLVAVFLFGFVPKQQDQIVVYLVGDSTCSIKETNAYPETGWGMPFVYFFDSTVRIENRARNGRSTKSFMEEGRWDDVMSTLKEGDYVFIQFGHNDEVPSKVGRYTTPDQFQTNLKKYVADSRSKGAIPILLTPVTRRSFKEGVLTNTHEEYAQLVRDVATSEEVLLMDMTKITMDYISQLGEEKSKMLFMHLEKGEHPNYPNGKSDNTHTNALGARKVAQLVLDQIEASELELKNRVIVGTR